MNFLTCAFSDHLQRIISFLVPVALISTTYLYTYPIFLRCTFPSPGVSTWQSTFRTLVTHRLGIQANNDNADVPFRLLVFGDPQLEGDSSLESTEDSYLFGHHLRPLRSLRKRLDLLGNDYYLAHIYKTLHRWTRPTHVTVLGDLLGSQWVTDEEFHRRASRFWGRVFRGGVRVDDALASDRREVLGSDQAWQRRIINVAGNHDVGYAGDMIGPRIERFETTFGKSNWLVRFQLPGNDGNDPASAERSEVNPELRVVILNSLNLDGPVADAALQGRTYDFLNHAIATSRPVEDQTAATILLTHLPLPKQAGVCVDGPFIAYNEHTYGGGVKEQNHLSRRSGESILEGLFGMSAHLDAPNKGLGRPGVILTGHDHEGCDVYHRLPRRQIQDDRTQPSWNVTPWVDASSTAHDVLTPGIREITVRSMMGEFGGNAGLLSAWYDGATRRWRFEYSSCMVGVQHIWWAVHIIDLLALLSIIILLTFLSLSSFFSSKGKDVGPSKEKAPSGNKHRRGSRIRTDHGHHSSTTPTTTLTAKAVVADGPSHMRRKVKK